MIAELAETPHAVGGPAFLNYTELAHSLWRKAPGPVPEALARRAPPPRKPQGGKADLKGTAPALSFQFRLCRGNSDGVSWPQAVRSPQPATRRFHSRGSAPTRIPSSGSREGRCCPHEASGAVSKGQGARVRRSTHKSMRAVLTHISRQKYF